MTIALLFTVLASLQAPVQDAPNLAPGASAAFQSVCLAIEDALAEGDVAAARAASGALPTRAFSIAWDDAAVPASQRAEFADARDQIAKLWTKGLPEVAITLSPRADLRIRFVKSLPAASGEPHPQGAVFFASMDPADPRIEAVIALERGNPARPVQAADVHNEVGYAIGAYFGLAQSPLTFGPVMGRLDLPWYRFLAPTVEEYRLARANLEAADALRKAVLKGVKLRPSRPQLLVSPPVLPTESVLQGEPIRFAIQVSNRGNAPLMMELRPDCGCLTATSTATVMAGDTMLLQAQIDTTEFVGELHKRLIVFSNDPDFPVREIPITVHVKPRYRLLSPAGPVVLAGASGTDLDVYLSLSDDAGFMPLSVKLNGLKGTVKMTPWQGKLADPELGQSERDHRGYRFAVHLDDALPPGRGNASLVIETDSPRFQTLYHSFSVQKGIVALPDQVYMGEIAQAPRRAGFLLSRPGKGFGIVSIKSSNPALTFTHVPVRDKWEHLVTVQFDGKAPFGVLNAMIEVETDDPDQRKILVPLQAVIR